MHINPLVTIITPTYNRASFIKQTIESVLNQTYQNIEYLILDDNSTDNTKEIVSSFNDPRIKYIYNNSNQGNLVVSTKGMNLASGYYLGVVDSDDFLELTCIEECINNIGNAGMIYTQAQYTGDKEGVVPNCKYKYSKENLLRVFMTFHFRMFKTELWHQVKPLTNVWHAWDYDFSLRISEITNIAHIKKPLYNWRIHPGNLHKDLQNIRKDIEIIRETAKKRRQQNQV